MTSNPNKPGKPANPPQHRVGDERGKPPAGKRREGLPSGENTGGAADVADPHPSQEEGYDRKGKNIPMTGL